MVNDVLSALDGKIDATPLIPPFEEKDKYFKETVLLDYGVDAFAKSLRAYPQIRNSR